MICQTDKLIKKVEKKAIENYKREQEFIQKEETLINRFRA